MPGRPSKRDAEGDDTRRGSGVVPAGALAMLLAISGVFAYGIYLKAAGPSPSENASPAHRERAEPSPGAARPSTSPGKTSPEAGPPAQIASGYGDEALDATPPSGAVGDLLPPVIPEATTAGTLSGGVLGGGLSSTASPRPSSSRPSPAAPAPPPPARPSSGPASGATASSARAGTPTPSKTALAPAPRPAPIASDPAPSRAASRSAQPTAPPAKARHAEPSPSSRETVVDAARPSHLTLAPRGAAPAVALKKAREQFTAKKYQEAARSWNDWAQRIPPGSWTVQIAAVRLDKAASAGALDSLGGRDGAFVLPPGALAGGFSPVCVGVYPSEEAARNAAARMTAASGSSSRPIAKPLSSLAN